MREHHWRRLQGPPPPEAVGLGLQRRVVKLGQRLGLQPGPRGNRLGARPLGERGAHGPVADVTRRLFAEPLQRGCAVQLRPLLRDNEGSILRILRPGSWRRPTCRALRVPAGRPTRRRKKNRLFELRVETLAVQDHVRPVQCRLRATAAHELLDGHHHGFISVALRPQGVEVGTQPLRSPRRPQPAAYHTVPDFPAQSGMVLGELLRRELRGGGVELRPAFEGRPHSHLTQLRLTQRPGQRVIDRAGRVEAGPGGKQRPQVAGLDQRVHALVDGHHLGQRPRVEAFQELRGPRQALDDVAFAEAVAERRGEVRRRRRRRRGSREAAEGEGRRHRPDPKRGPQRPVRSLHHLVSRCGFPVRGRDASSTSRRLRWTLRS